MRFYGNSSCQKKHNTREQLILHCCEDIISNAIDSSELKKLKYVSLSNDTVSRRIGEMSDNILSQVVSKIQNSIFSFFAIQLETTDVAN